MRRREFMTLLGNAGAAAAAFSHFCPPSVRAQPALPVIGFLSTRSFSQSAPFAAAFLRGLSENGFVEFRNVAVAYRFADDRFERLPELAADLVRNRVAVIVTGATPAIVAAKA